MSTINNNSIANLYKLLIERDKNDLLLFDNHFKNYIKATAHYDCNNCPDFETLIKTQVIESTKGLFSLPQLFCIYWANFSEFGMCNSEELKDLKSSILDEIDREVKEKVNLGNIKDFKKKITELDTIVLSILDEILRDSIKTYDNYGYLRPEFDNDQRAFLTELQNAHNTNDAIKKIQDTCVKNSRVDTRIERIKEAGIEVKQCWVRSGGVTSVFFMEGKKEIRVQVAASKFKGNGTKKSKSALCAVLPLPEFLHGIRSRNLVMI
jgi:hypothetical protein